MNKPKRKLNIGKMIIIHVFCFSFLCTMSYLAGAIIAWELDMALWDIDMRAGLVIFTFIIYPVIGGGLQYFMNEAN